MPDCPRISGCSFFADRLAKMPVMAETMKNKYCQTDHRLCARHIVATSLGREHVPADLFPAQTKRAQAMVGGQ